MVRKWLMRMKICKARMRKRFGFHIPKNAFNFEIIQKERKEKWYNTR